MKKLDVFDLIILIDDDEVTNFLNKRVIQETIIDSNVEVIENGGTAIEFLEEIKNNGSAETMKSILIFLDINMPGISGWDFIGWYKNFSKDLRKKITITMLTTSSNLEDENRAKENPNIRYFMKKPMTSKQLKAIISS